MIYHHNKKIYLRTKEHSRHYYLGRATFNLRRGNYEEMLSDLMVVERLQVDIENLESERI